MKQYVIDQLRESDYLKILDFMKANAEAGAFDDVFWVMIPEELYTTVQQEHAECRPFCFAVNVTRNQAEFELLIRSRNAIRCSCIGFADRKQRDYILDYADSMLKKLEIKI